MAGGRPLFAAEYRAVGWRTLGSDFQAGERFGSGSAEQPEHHSPSRAIEPLRGLAGRPVFAFCGLGRPDSFMRSLQSLGLNLRRFTPLRDHQVYDRSTLNRLSLDFLASGAEVMVTTVKDAVKIPPDFPWPVKALEMDLVIDQPDEFAGTVLKIIERRTSGA